eukprot:scaffold4723_cov172-Amphora_coffeaeformis.AAC.12
MKSSSSTSSILRLNDKNNERGPYLRRSNSSVTVLHQKQLPSYGAERFYILSELQMNSVPPTFLCENNNSVDDSMTAETVELHSLEGSNSREASQSSLPLQPYSILYLVWRPTENKHNEVDSAVSSFCNEVVVPAVHKIQGIIRIRRPSIGQSSSSSSLSRYGSEDDFNDDSSEHQHPPDFVRQPMVGESDCSSTTVSTRLYLVVEQVPGNIPFHEDAETAFLKLERCATELARCVSTHTELRDLVQGVTVGVSNLERAAPGLEACMNAFHVGSQDRRRHGVVATPEGGSKSLIGLVTDSYNDLMGPEDHHSHDHGHRGDADDGSLPPILRQCLVTAEWSAAGDLMTFAHRAHNVWRDQHRLPALSTRWSRKKLIRRARPPEVGLDAPLTTGEMLYQSAIFAILVLYFFFHYRNDAVELVRYKF